MKTHRFTTLLTAASILIGITALNDDARAADKTELAKASQNPVSSLISVPFENNFNLNAGPEDKLDYVLNIKPVLPVGLTGNWNLINRAIVPVINQGERFPGQGSQFGLGDITYQGFLTPAKTGKFIWGLGPMLVMPTGTDNRLTSGKWSAGPAAVGLSMPGHWVLGALLYNVWSFAGADDNPEVNTMGLQYFINYNLPDGWYLSMSPTITANWEADSDNTWTVPVGGGFGRVFKIARQPINASLKANYSVERPDDASDWNIAATVTFLFPK
ncbi:MAG: transporter [Desulfobacterales bacterium]